jgi:hypothetical protein
LGRNPEGCAIASAEFERLLAVTLNELDAAQGFGPQSDRLEVLGVWSGCR